MVELGDLREGVAAADVVDVACEIHRQLPAAARRPRHQPGLPAAASCPTRRRWPSCPAWPTRSRRRRGIALTTVSGGNSANLNWALTHRRHRADQRAASRRGDPPRHRAAAPDRPIEACAPTRSRLVAEVIEAKTTSRRSPGVRSAQTPSVPGAGSPPGVERAGTVRQAILALGHQDVDPDGARPAAGHRHPRRPAAITWWSTLGDHDVRVGDELAFGLGYGALLRAMTSPFVSQVETRRPALPVLAAARLPAPVIA